MDKKTVLSVGGKFGVADGIISTAAQVIVLSGHVQLAEGVTVIGPDGTQWGPIVVGLALASTLSEAPPKFKAHNMDMLYAIMDSIPEKVFVTLELTPEGHCEDVYKITHPDGLVEFMDAKNQPGSYNYLLPKQGISAERSIDALVVQEKERDENNGVTLPSKALVSREAKNIIYNGSSQSKAARKSLGRICYWLPSSPDDYLAGVFASINGNEYNFSRTNTERVRLSRSIPPRPYGAGG